MAKKRPAKRKYLVESGVTFAHKRKLTKKGALRLRKELVGFGIPPESIRIYEVTKKKLKWIA